MISLEHVKNRPKMTEKECLLNLHHEVTQLRKDLETLKNRVLSNDETTWEMQHNIISCLRKNNLDLSMQTRARFNPDQQKLVVNFP